MTIHVSVMNKDSRETAVISVREMSTQNVECNSTELKGGESVDLHVHSDCHLLVQEVKAP